MRKSIILSLLAIATFQSCQERSVAEWPYGVNYEVFVLAFADSNGDGKGDFNGLTA